MKKYLALAACLGLLLSSFGHIAMAADYGSSTLTPAETKALLDARAEDKDRDNYVSMYMECCGIDLKNQTARVTNKMLSQRDTQMKEMFEHHKDYNMWREYDRFLTACKINPTILYDVAPVIDNQGNGLQSEEVFNAFADACGNPPNPVLTKFIQKFKVIHFKLATDIAKRQPEGFIYNFNEANGELDVSVFNQGTNIAKKTFEWLQNQ